MNASVDIYEKTRHERFAKDFGALVARSLTDTQSPIYGALFETKRPRQCWGLSGFPMNGASEAMLFLMAKQQGYTDHRWFRYDQADMAGGQVRANERSTTIKDYNRRVGQTYYPSLFNADQVKNLPAAEPITRPTQEEGMAAAQALLDKARFPIETGYAKVDVGFDPETTTIRLGAKDTYVTEAFYYADALKALAQSTAHRDVMNREVGDGYKARAMEALRVNVAAHMMSERLGLPFDLGRDIQYTKVWAEAAQEKPEQVVRAFSDAERIAYELGVYAPRYPKTPLVEKTPEQVERAKEAQQQIEQAEETSRAASKKQAVGRTTERQAQRAQQTEREQSARNTPKPKVRKDRGPDMAQAM